jgi:putative ABC transport system permease protein
MVPLRGFAYASRTLWKSPLFTVTTITIGANTAIFSVTSAVRLRLSIAGIAIGIIVAFLLRSLMTTMLVGVEATDPATFATMIAVFLVIAAAASWLPERRAAALDPTVALREA